MFSQIKRGQTESQWYQICRECPNVWNKQYTSIYPMAQRGEITKCLKFKENKILYIYVLLFLIYHY